jgi:hypothetical protein
VNLRIVTHKLFLLLVLSTIIVNMFLFGFEHLRDNN